MLRGRMVATRRNWMRWAVGTLAASAVGCDGSRPRGDSRAMSTATNTRMPVGFAAHGAPTIALDSERGAPLAAWARAMTRPRAILVVSAHWEDAPVTIGTTQRKPLVYDFSGFPPPLYQVRYDAPAAPDVADRVASLLGGAARTDRGWDHGVWTPLVHMFPEADVPLLQISMPSREGAGALVELGRRLAPLRDEGVLILGSGNLVHNLRRLDFTERRAPASWAREFDAWTADVLRRGDIDALAAYRDRAPGLNLAHPTHEHLLPILVVAGAGAADLSRVSFPVEGWEYGSLSRRCVQIG